MRTVRAFVRDNPGRWLWTAAVFALSALLPLLPAKQRPLQDNDWMRSDCMIACPDPNCGAQFKITRLGRRRLSHSACTVVDIPTEGDAHEPQI